MRSGWAQVERSVLDGPVMGCAELSQLYLYGMLHAVHKHQWVSMKVGQGRVPVELWPGQWIFGRFMVSEKLGQAPRTCYNRLLKLASLGLVTLETCPHWTVVTMCSSATSEAEDAEVGPAPARHLPATCPTTARHLPGSCPPPATYKNEEKEEKEENAIHTFAPSRPRTIPEPAPEPEAEGSWLLDDMAPEQVSELMEPAEPEQATMPEALKPHRRIRWNRDEQRIDGIIETDIERWEEAYPAVDVHSALRQMEVWLAANPTKAVRRNYARFVINWLSREQERGGNRGRGPGKQPLVITDPDARTAELIRDLEMHQRR